MGFHSWPEEKGAAWVSPYHCGLASVFSRTPSQGAITRRPLQHGCVGLALTHLPCQGEEAGDNRDEESPLGPSVFVGPSQGARLVPLGSPELHGRGTTTSAQNGEPPQEREDSSSRPGVRDKGGSRIASQRLPRGPRKGGGHVPPSTKWLFLLTLSAS